MQRLQPQLAPDVRTNQESTSRRAELLVVFRLHPPQLPHPDSRGDRVPVPPGFTNVTAT